MPPTPPPSQSGRIHVPLPLGHWQGLEVICVPAPQPHGCCQLRKGELQGFYVQLLAHGGDLMRVC